MAQEHLREIEDEFNAIQAKSYNAEEICDQPKEFVSAFPTLSDGERALLIDSLTTEVAVKNIIVIVTLRPPLHSFGFLSTEIAPKGLEPIHRLQIILEYTLPRCSELATSGELISRGLQT